MRFKKEEIIKFKRKGYSYIQTGGIEAEEIQKYMHGIAKYTVIEAAEDKDPFMRAPYSDEFLPGNFTKGVKYVLAGKNYYMMWRKRDGEALLHSVAIGRMKKGKIYMIEEKFRTDLNKLTFIRFPKEIRQGDEASILKDIYINTIDVRHKSDSWISDEDLTCIDIAYQAIKIFSELLQNWKF